MDIHEFVEQLPDDIALLVKCKQKMNELLANKLRSLRKIKQNRKKRLVVRPRIYISESSSDEVE
jgi:hypothetical protein